MSSRPSSSDFLGVALASAAVLALQVTASRLFSFLIWYHFAFLVLSIAFLGFTAGGLAAGKLSSVRADPRPVLAWLGLAAGASTLACFFALARLPLAAHFAADIGGSLAFLSAVLVVLVPFVCLGAYLCLALSAWSERVALLYAVDLAGSASGCVLAAALLNTLGVPAALLSNGLIAFLAGACMLQNTEKRRAGRVAVFAVALGWCFAINAARNELAPWVYMKTSKPYPKLPRELVAARRSDSLSTVEMFTFPNAGTLTLWGLSPLYQRPVPDIVGFAIDGWALTATYNRTQVDVPDSVLDYLPAALPYRFHHARDALIIGPGGGLDVLTALHYGAQHVTAAEINPIIVGAVQHDLADFSGHLYQDPRVEIHLAEGRHYLRRDARKYDLVQLSGVDTYAASQAGAFALHENYLYTVEAMHDYLDALRPNGLLTFTRWLYIPERQTIRLCIIADRAFRERGVEHPERHIVVFESHDFSIVMIKEGEFTPAEVASLQNDTSALGFSLIYAPHLRVNPLAKRWGPNPFYKLWDDGPERFVANYPLDVRPTTDDRPFFFEYQRWGGASASENLFHSQNAHVVLLETLGICGFLCAVVLVLAQRRHRAPGRALGAAAHVYFVALGLAYIFVENVLVQRILLFLGSPIYALTVILFAVLASSATGSALAARFGSLRDQAPAVMLCAATLLVVFAASLRPVLDALLGLELPVRMVVVVLAVAPLGVLMGMPFPLALSRLSEKDPNLLPWAWVINGAASVLGSIVTVMLAMTSGFNVVFAGAALLYVVAAATYSRILPAHANPSPVPG